MTRPTLKLPVRTESSPTSDAAQRRKPLRAGATPDKRQRPTPKATTTASAPAAERAPAPPSFRPRDRREQAAVAAPSGSATPAKKTHPPRGIARSSGVRAALPSAVESPHRSPAVDETRRPPANAPHRLPEASPPAAPDDAPQRGPAKELPRLAKRVSEQTQCSRREADTWIENGWVTVDGVVVNRLGARVSPKARVEVKAIADTQHSKKLTLILNQPLGEPWASAGAALATLVRPEGWWSADDKAGRVAGPALRGLAAIGKLAPDEHGLLVLTQDGSLARRLTDSRVRLEQEFHLRVEGEMVADGLQRLRQGLTLDRIKLGRSHVSWLAEHQLRFVTFENRKRQIQRMCELVGLRVTDIKRVRIGRVSLGRLPPGRWRLLRPDEQF